MRYLALSINGTDMPAPGNIPTGGTLTLNSLISNGLTIFLIVSAIVALVLFILGGIEWIASDGDKQKIAHARSRIIYAILGLLLILLSFFIVNFVFSNFGITK